MFHDMDCYQVLAIKIRADIIHILSRIRLMEVFILCDLSRVSSLLLSNVLNIF